VNNDNPIALHDDAQPELNPINPLPEHVPPAIPDSDDTTPGLDAKIDDLQITAEFIEALRTATLE
jgi:hypothetical protein